MIAAVPRWRRRAMESKFIHGSVNIFLTSRLFQFTIFREAGQGKSYSRAFDDGERYSFPVQFDINSTGMPVGLVLGAGKKFENRFFVHVTHLKADWCTSRKVVCVPPKRPPNVFFRCRNTVRKNNEREIDPCCT